MKAGFFFPPFDPFSGITFVTEIIPQNPLKNKKMENFNSISNAANEVANALNVNSANTAAIENAAPAANVTDEKSVKPNNDTLQKVVDKWAKNKAAAKKYADVKIKVQGSDDPARLPAFSNINRTVDEQHVAKILEIMNDDGFWPTHPILVTKAETVLDMDLFDINGVPIQKNTYAKYSLIDDGQHRTFAVSMYNDWLRSKGRESELIEVPAIELKLLKDETIMQRLAKINDATKKWATGNWMHSVAIIRPEELFRRFDVLMDEDYTLSVCNLYYDTNLNTDDLKALSEGKTTKGKRPVKPIIPEDVNVAAGDELIEICRNAGFLNSEINGRYIPQAFNRLFKKGDFSRNEAKNIFKSLTAKDVRAMRNDKDKLDEDKIISQMKEVVERYCSEQTKDK